MPIELKRELDLKGATFYATGLIIGAGIYAVIGKAAGLAGPSLPLSFLLASIIAFFTAMSYAELSTSFPEEGAEYVYTHRAFHNEKFSTLLALMRIFAGIAAASAVSLAFAGYLSGLINISIVPVSILLILLLSFINFYGIKLSSELNIAFTLMEIFGLIIVIFIGIPHLTEVNLLSMPNSLSGLFNASFLAFFAYIGFESLANITEETKNPEKIIPRALILSIVITTILYFLASLSSVSLVGWKELDASSSPLSLVASQGLGGIGFLILSIIALFSTTNTVLISLVSSSRMLYGSCKEKFSSLPHCLSKVHSKTKTPYISILITMLVAILLTLGGGLKDIANLTNLFIFSIFFIVNVSLIVLRYKKEYLKLEDRGFKSPLNIGNFPVLAFLGALTSVGFILFFFLNLV